MERSSNVLMPSLSGTSLDLPENDLGFPNEMEGPCTSNSSGSRHLASTVSNYLQPRHHYSTRLAVQCRKSCTPATNRIEDVCQSRSCNHIYPISSGRSYYRRNQNFISRSLHSLSYSDLDNRANGADLTPYTNLERRRASSMNCCNACPCSCRRRARKKKRYWLTASLIFFIGLLYWGVKSYFRGLETDICGLKDIVERMKYGRMTADRKTTQQKLEQIETHLWEIKKAQAKAYNTPMCSSLESACDNDPVRDRVQAAVKEALEAYGNDRTGKTDFALESAGGHIYSIVNTEPFEPRPKSTFLGIPLCQDINGPRAIINAGMSPGQCWAFKGSAGSVVIRLLGSVFVKGVSIEHISKRISPFGEIDTAPKDFSVWGLNDGTPGQGQLLGEFTYSADGETLQYFPIDCGIRPYTFVQFSVLSNHGNPVFTCVYRFRVHGVLDTETC